jgi:hypothetical protein
MRLLRQVSVDCDQATLVDLIDDAADDVERVRAAFYADCAQRKTGGAQ